MINSTNLLTIKTQKINQPAISNPISGQTSVQPSSLGNSGLLSAYLNNMAMINAPVVQKSAKVEKTENSAPVNYHNNLRSMFKNNEAKILAIIPRTFSTGFATGYPTKWMEKGIAKIVPANPVIPCMMLAKKITM